MASILGKWVVTLREDMTLEVGKMEAEQTDKYSTATSSSEDDDYDPITIKSPLKVCTKLIS